IENVAFFCTFKNSGDDTTLKQMEELVGKKPVVAMSFKEGIIKDGSYLTGIGNFIDGITI
ncbi:MAG: hypothetical protein JW825_03060, partial [Candidatus Methanofastidiosa archaeon]|nr:hypothetical protein [Candidatus Methanofastidiosa archaeon]